MCPFNLARIAREQVHCLGNVGFRFIQLTREDATIRPPDEVNDRRSVPNGNRLSSADKKLGDFEGLGLFNDVNRTFGLVCDISDGVFGQP